MQKGAFAVCTVTVLVGLLIWLAGTQLVQHKVALFNSGEQLAAVFFVPGISVAELQRKYDKAPKTKKEVRILLVPGHEPFYGGAEYGGLKERDMAVALAQELSALLNSNSRYETIMSRDAAGWNPTFLSYFADNWDAIRAFAQQQKVEMAKHIGAGALIKHDPAMIHNTAPSDVAFRLYGIHKWANENQVDVSIHIHFNDNPRKNTFRAGNYAGFAIYVPDPQYSNGTTARSVADSIFARLSQKYSPSNMPKEAPGIIESQDLIAVGSNNTSDAPSILIEYSYIYEPMLQDPTTRAQALQDMARQTYEGLQDFFENRNKPLVQNTR